MKPTGYPVIEIETAVDRAAAATARKAAQQEKKITYYMNLKHTIF